MNKKPDQRLSKAITPDTLVGEVPIIPQPASLSSFPEPVADIPHRFDE